MLFGKLNQNWCDKNRTLRDFDYFQFGSVFPLPQSSLGQQPLIASSFFPVHFPESSSLVVG